MNTSTSDVTWWVKEFIFQFLLDVGASDVRRFRTFLKVKWILFCSSQIQYRTWILFLRDSQCSISSTHTFPSVFKNSWFSGFTQGGFLSILILKFELQWLPLGHLVLIDVFLIPRRTVPRGRNKCSVKLQTCLYSITDKLSWTQLDRWTPDLK